MFNIVSFKTLKKKELKDFLMKRYPSCLSLNCVSDDFIVDLSELEALILENDDTSQESKAKEIGDLFMIFVHSGYDFKLDVEYSNSSIVRHGLTSKTGLFKVEFVEVVG